MGVWGWILVGTAWVVFFTAHYLTRNTGRHHMRKSWFRKRPVVRDELLIRSTEVCEKCQEEVYVFADTCKSCGYVRYEPDAQTLRMPVTHHRRPEPAVRAVVMS